MLVSDSSTARPLANPLICDQVFCNIYQSFSSSLFLIAFVGVQGLFLRLFCCWTTAHQLFYCQVDTGQMTLSMFYHAAAIVLVSRLISSVMRQLSLRLSTSELESSLQVCKPLVHGVHVVRVLNNIPSLPLTQHS
jgi:hypothetical protein